MTETRDMLSDAASRLPSERLSTYARLWQFETWLRTMVYVELRARYGDDWESRLQEPTEKPHDQDKKLSHMPTRESLPTSYMQLAGLLRTVEIEWILFEPYLPPKQIWEAKLLEVKQIRHRVAHFRLGHQHDGSRVEQLLRDVDQGFWRFCTSYNSDSPILPPTKDPVTKKFLHLDPFLWTEVEPRKWARCGSADPDLLVSVEVNVLCREWLKSPAMDEVADGTGYLYDAKLAARNRQRFDYSRFLKATEHMHSSLCHICLDNSARTLRLTIPAILGATIVIDIYERLIGAAESALCPAVPWTYKEAVGEPGNETWADAFAEQYPEYVLGPSNPLTFLGPDMPCSFFNVD